MATPNEFESILARVEGPGDKPGRTDSPSRIARALNELGLTEAAKASRPILIAGTNGKGSVAKTLETIFSARGEGVGLFTSPHLVDVGERIRTNGKDLSHDEFVEVFERVEDVVARLDLGRFETMTVMMAEAFWGDRVRPRVERAVVEVGVGGRLDPTRGLPHDVSVLTSLAFDHMELLGESLLSIGQEKARIVDPDNLVVHAPWPREASAALDEARRARGVRFIEAASFPHRIDHTDRIEKTSSPRWVLLTPWGEAPLALLGERAAANATIALRVVEGLGLDPREALPALAKVKWPGRMERVVIGGRVLYLSGDHNPRGVESLIEILKHFEYETLRLVVGIGSNKPAEEMLGPLFGLPRVEASLCRIPFRPTQLSAYGAWSARATGGCFEDSLEAVESALSRANAGDLVVVTGSLYLVGHVRKAILEGRFGNSHFEF